jgi:hypothetical protein
MALGDQIAVVVEGSIQAAIVPGVVLLAQTEHRLS